MEGSKSSVVQRSGYTAPSCVEDGDPAEDPNAPRASFHNWDNYYDRDGRQRVTKKVNSGKVVRHIKLRFVMGMVKKKAAGEKAKESPTMRSLMILKVLLLEPINLLLFAAPVGIVAAIQEWGAVPVFCGCFFALIPLAKLLGDATEHLAEGLNQTVGGLLNATFGNAVEMIVTLSAIRRGLLGVVKHSLVGSILSNLLLVLGMAFFAGGLRYQDQKFSGAAALINITMLLVGIMSFCLPTVFFFSLDQGHNILSVSRLSAIFVGIGYIAYLVFQLYTHVEVFEEKPEDAGEECSGPEGAPRDSHEGEPEAVLDVHWAIGLMLGTTAAVSFLSQYMVDSIEGIVEQWHVSQAFVGCILVPIVGNACEHASAVRMAYNNKVAAAIAVAVGSSTQISMLVMPFAVLVGWTMGRPLDLNMSPMGLSVLFLAVMVVFSIVTDGKSNWLEGFMLMLSYCLVAILYWYTPDEALTTL